ncbi:MAG: hypothetical protein AB7H80_06935 [Candidatus Kapaibacterium sp.]
MTTMKTGSTVVVSSIVAGIILSAGLFAGCGSSRTSIEGYSDAVLTGKRLFILMPKEGDFVLTNSEAFAYSRGIAALSSQSRVDNEFQTQFRDYLDNVLDSNLVVVYRTQPVGAIHPLDATRDFNGEIGSWNWEEIDAARKEGAIDFLLVLQKVQLENQTPSDNAGRGKESVTVNFILVDPAKRSVMTQNQVSVSLKDPREIRDTYSKLTRELASKMPFHVKEN